jgi:hypothetical protein
MTYTPNFADPRVIKRVQQALGFARACFNETKPRAWSTRYIDKHFGSQRNELSRWLRRQLLTTTTAWYSMDQGKCKEYTLNKPGYDAVSAQLKSDNHATISVYDLPLQWAQAEFKDELATKVFTYRDLKGRLWHPLQNVRREYKRTILAQANLKYQYDIQCCAPTLIMQHAQQQEDAMDEIPEYIDAYLKDRKGIRNTIAQQVELDPSAIKILVNALFSGAKLGNNSTFAIYKMLNGDRARIEYLKQDPFITGLKQDIKMCWDYIKPSMPRTSVRNKNNKEQLLPLSSKDKWTRYFSLERRVLNAVINYLNLNEIQFFAEHDGWTTNELLDQNELVEHVYKQTGFRIKLELEINQ